MNKNDLNKAIGGLDIPEIEEYAELEKKSSLKRVFPIIAVAGIAAAAAIVIGLSFFNKKEDKYVAKADTLTAEEIEEVFDLLQKDQQAAVAAAEKLGQGIMQGSYVREAYRGDYGGCYIKGDRLVILIKSGGDVMFYKSLFSEDDPVDFEIVSHSEAELRDYMEKFLEENDIKWYEAYVDIKAGKAVIGCIYSDYVKLMEEKNFDEELLMFTTVFPEDKEEYLDEAKLEASEKRGIKAYLEDYTSDGGILRLVCEGKNGASFGDDFKLLVKTEKGWKYMEEEGMFVSDSILYGLEAGGESTHKYDWSRLYGTLEPGEYLFEKRISTKTDECVYARFTIE